MDERKVQELAARATHLTALGNSPSYPVLKEIVEGKIRSETRRFISTAAVEQQQLDYGRGLLRGMQLVLEIIERGEKELERAFKQARLIEQVQEGVNELG